MQPPKEGPERVLTWPPSVPLFVGLTPFSTKRLESFSSRLAGGCKAKREFSLSHKRKKSCRFSVESSLPAERPPTSWPEDRLPPRFEAHRNSQFLPTTEIAELPSPVKHFGLFDFIQGIWRSWCKRCLYLNMFRRSLQKCSQRLSPSLDSLHKSFLRPILRVFEVSDASPRSRSDSLQRHSLSTLSVKVALLGFVAALVSCFPRQALAVSRQAAVSEGFSPATLLASVIKVDASVVTEVASNIHLLSLFLGSQMILIFACAFFSMAETAITTLWPWKVREIAEREGPGSPFALIQKDVTRFLTTILVGNNLAIIFATALTTEQSTKVLSPGGVAVVTWIMSFLILFLGEILPKSAAVHRAEPIARIIARPIYLLSQILFPVGRFFEFASSFTLRLFGLDTKSEVTVTDQELKLVVAGAERSGAIEEAEEDMINSVLELDRTEVREVMVNRVDMVAVEASMTLRQFLNSEREHRYSRVPVYQGNIDNIVGIVYTKELLRCVEHPELLESLTVGRIAKPAYFIPESMPVWNLLMQMRLRNTHIAIVVDEFGGTAGLVTLEDCIEEIVGEIYDETDEAANPVKPLPDGLGFLIKAQASLSTVSRELGIELPDGEYETIAGYLFDVFGYIPQVGESVVTGQYEFFIDQADDRHIIMVRAEYHDQTDDDKREAEAMLRDAHVTAPSLRHDESDDQYQNGTRKAPRPVRLPPAGPERGGSESESGSEEEEWVDVGSGGGVQVSVDRPASGPPDSDSDSDHKIYDRRVQVGADRPASGSPGSDSDSDHKIYDRRRRVARGRQRGGPAGTAEAVRAPVQENEQGWAKPLPKARARAGSPSTSES